MSSDLSEPNESDPDPAEPGPYALEASDVPQAVVEALRSGEVDVTTLVHRMQDARWLDNADLLESLAQIRRGEFTVVRPVPPAPE